MTAAKKLKAVACALIGHSRIIHTCFGYVHCARCDAQIGDTLGGAYDAKRCVILYHDCPTCREAAETLTWKDRLLVPNPFDPARIAEQQSALERARESLDAIRTRRRSQP